jgi:serine protease Do
VSSRLVFPSITELVDQLAPTVVSIVVESEQTTGFFGTPRVTGSGSGVIFREEGYILTNNHVVEGATRISVSLFDGREAIAVLVGTDPRTDIAVIKVNLGNLSAAPLGDASSMRVGDWVIAIGNALALRGDPTVTVGVVSAIGRSIPLDNSTNLSGLIQTDAAINPGNSGGALINLRGEVIGLNTAILRGQDAQGIGFAVSTETAIPVADQLIANGRVVRAYLGVFPNDLDRAMAAEMDIAAREGVVMVAVEPGTPAEKAGILEEDVLIALDDQAVPNVVTLERLLIGHFQVGQTIVVTVLSGSERRMLSLTLGENPG